MDPPAGSAAQRERQRIGFRARAVDVTTRLAILRSMEELAEEATVSRVAAHSHVQLDRENEEVRHKLAAADWRAARWRARSRARTTQTLALFKSRFEFSSQGPNTFFAPLSPRRC